MSGPSIDERMELLMHFCGPKSAIYGRKFAVDDRTLSGCCELIGYIVRPFYRSTPGRARLRPIIS